MQQHRLLFCFVIWRGGLQFFDFFFFFFCACLYFCVQLKHFFTLWLSVRPRVLSPRFVLVQLWTCTSSSRMWPRHKSQNKRVRLDLEDNNTNETCEALACSWATVFTLDPNLPLSVSGSHRGEWNELMLVQLRPKLLSASTAARPREWT